eukprot:Opistho-2@29004
MRGDRIGARARGIEIDVEHTRRSGELQLAAGALADVEPRFAEHPADGVGAVADQRIILHRPNHRRWRRPGGGRRCGTRNRRAGAGAKRQGEADDRRQPVLLDHLFSFPSRRCSMCTAIAALRMGANRLAMGTMKLAADSSPSDQRAGRSKRGRSGWRASTIASRSRPSSSALTSRAKIGVPIPVMRSRI